MRVPWPARRAAAALSPAVRKPGPPPRQPGVPVEPRPAAATVGQVHRAPGDGFRRGGAHCSTPAMHRAGPGLRPQQGQSMPPRRPRSQSRRRFRAVAWIPRGWPGSGPRLSHPRHSRRAEVGDRPDRMTAEARPARLSSRGTFRWWGRSRNADASRSHGPQSWRWHLIRQQSLRLELPPQVTRDFGLERIDVFFELGYRTAAHEHACDRRMAEWKSHRGRLHRDEVVVTYRRNAPRPLYHIGRGRDVVESRPGLGVCKQPAVEDSADDDRDSLRLAERKELSQTRLIEQGVAPSQEEAIEVRLESKTHQHFRLVHSGTDCTDDSFRSQIGERPKSPGDRLVVMVVGIVDVKDVDAIEMQSLETVLERAHHTVMAEVENGGHRRGGLVEGFAVEELTRIRLAAGLEQPADLGRQDEGLTWPGRERGTDPVLGETVAVERCRVEESDATFVGELDHLPRLFVAHL